MDARQDFLNSYYNSFKVLFPELTEEEFFKMYSSKDRDEKLKEISEKGFPELEASLKPAFRALNHGDIFLKDSYNMLRELYNRVYMDAKGEDKKMLDELNKEIVVMHPGPINRGVELTSDAADSHHSIILDQVENGVAVRMAVLYLLAGQN